MLRIGICDDNQNDIKQICELAIRFSEEHPETPLQIQAYDSPFDLLDDIEKNGGFDLYLLDVIMPHMTGVTLAKRIRERKEKAEILFLTFSKEYAVDAFSVKASGYLIKPVNKPDFDDAVLDCIHRLLPTKNPSITLKSKPVFTVYLFTNWSALKALIITRLLHCLMVLPLRHRQH